MVNMNEDWTLPYALFEAMLYGPEQIDENEEVMGEEEEAMYIKEELEYEDEDIMGDDFEDSSNMLEYIEVESEPEFVPDSDEKELRYSPDDMAVSDSSSDIEELFNDTFVYDLSENRLLILPKSPILQTNENVDP